jgi:hypothetical protein
VGRLEFFRKKNSPQNRLLLCQFQTRPTTNLVSEWRPFAWLATSLVRGLTLLHAVRENGLSQRCMQDLL